MKDQICVIDVGIHPEPYWKDKITDIVVCDRHRKQYDTSGYGPFDWEEFKS